MDEVLRALLASGGGTACTSDLAAADYRPQDIERLVRAGIVRRVRRGAFVDALRFDAADKATQHGLLVRAVLGTLPGYAGSHLSAVVCWGLPVLRWDLGPVHVSGVGKGYTRHSSGLWVHAPVSAGDVTETHGIPVVVAELAVLQTCGSVGQRAGMIAAEAGLRMGLVCRDELVRRARGASWGPAAAHIVALADRYSESAGESWCRLVFAGLGLGQPEQQVDIRDEHDRFVARVDFLFREKRLIVEFDGAMKYGGAEGRAALVAEKRREDALRRLGYRVVRLTWADLRDPARVRTMLGL
ncbi:MAG: type IV toxin-antitoxin system AbiEi family antitoxin domain-containing protein [Dermatophilaceae bacterium]